MEGRRGDQERKGKGRGRGEETGGIEEGERAGQAGKEEAGVGEDWPMRNFFHCRWPENIKAVVT